jgi:hypothetical protein
MRWLGRAANGLTDALRLARADSVGERLQLAAEGFAPALGLATDEMVSAAQSARGRLSQLASAMGLHVPRGAKSRRLLVDEASAAPAVAAGGLAPGASADAATVVLAPPAGIAVGSAPVALPTSASPGSEATLTNTLQQLGQALSDRSLRLNEMLNLVLEAMHRALELRSVVLCLRDTRDGSIAGRFGLGASPPAAFRIAPTASGDLFAAVLAKGADLHIADASAVAGKLPGWYRQRVNAGSFLLLPLMMKGAPIGLIYLDKAAPKSLRLADGELGLLRALRDRLLVAFQRGA